MELAYLPDNMLVMNGRFYYENKNLWNNVNSFKSAEKTSNSSQTKIDEKNCHICKEKKKRTLSNYIRSKSRRDSEPITQIREEDEDENEKNCGMNKHKR